MEADQRRKGDDDARGESRGDGMGRVFEPARAVPDVLEGPLPSRPGPEPSAQTLAPG